MSGTADGFMRQFFCSSSSSSFLISLPLGGSGAQRGIGGGSNGVCNSLSVCSPDTSQACTDQRVSVVTRTFVADIDSVRISVSHILLAWCSLKYAYLHTDTWRMYKGRKPQNKATTVGRCEFWNVLRLSLVFTQRHRQPQNALSSGLMWSD